MAEPEVTWHVWHVEVGGVAWCDRDLPVGAQMAIYERARLSGTFLACSHGAHFADEAERDARAHAALARACGVNAEALPGPCSGSFRKYREEW